MKSLYKLPIGAILVVAAILISRFVSSSPITDFLAGLFTGLSLVLNAFYIYHRSRLTVKA